MSEPALPCPYCKGTNRAFLEGKTLTGIRYRLTCEDCKVTGPLKQSKAEAIKGWNDMQQGGRKDAPEVDKQAP